MDNSHFLSTTPFDKEEFFSLIDCDGILDNENKQSFWDEYVMYNERDLSSFCETLDDLSPTTHYVKKSIGQFFSGSTFRGASPGTLAGKENRSL